MNTTTTKIPTYIGAAGEIEKFAMANCRFMLQNAAVSSVVGASNSGEHVGRMFDCKTCGRKFSSFQALGGHRASHKKAKLPNSGELSEESNIPVKPKIHACKICGVEFPIGQALGGHMRRHREMLEGNNNNGDDNNKILMITSAAMSGVTNEGSSGNSDANNDNSEKKRKNAAVDDEEVVLEVPVVTKKSSSCKRVRLDLDLDLSLWWKNEVVDEYNGDHEVEDEKDSLKLDLSLPTNYC